MLSLILALSCQTTLPQAVASMEAQGGHLVDLIDVPNTVHADQIVFIEIGGGLVAGLVKDGCMVTPPAVVDTVERGTPA